MTRWRKLAAALIAPLVLASCVLTPGKFVSTLRIDADGHFAFSYVGEVWAVDLDEAGAAAQAAGARAGGDLKNPADMLDEAAPDKKDDAAARKAKADAKNRAIAAALSKEAGYRKVTYEGDGRFLIDYAVSGTLDHAFVFPYNLDAQAVFPFLVIERRANGTVRVKAPGFANDNDKAPGIPGADANASKLDGSFTLDTDAEIVSQNNEDGTKTAAGRRTILWKATPLTREPPTAVLRLK